MKRAPRTFEEWMRFAHTVKAEAHERAQFALERQAHELERRMLVCQTDPSSPQWLEIKEGQRALLSAYVSAVAAAPATLPVPSLSERLERSLRSLAMELGKELTYDCAPHCARQLDQLPSSWREPVYSCLLAAARNSLDHGAVPKLSIRVHLDTGPYGLRLEFTDTGAGIDPAAVRLRVLEKGIHSQETLTQLPDEEVIQLLFVAGLSLKRQASALSGRGYGLDIVRESVESLGGQARLRSKLGGGTSLVLELPLFMSRSTESRSA